MIIKAHELVDRAQGYWYRDASGSRVRLDDAYVSYKDGTHVYVRAGRFSAVFGRDEDVEVELA